MHMNSFKLPIVFLTGLGMGYLLFAYLQDTHIDNPLIHNKVQTAEKTLLANQACSSGSDNTEEKPVATEISQSSEQSLGFIDKYQAIETDNYDDFITTVSAESAGQYQNLNDDLFNAFAFNNQKELDLALANGFPSPEELEYVYNKDMDELIADIQDKRDRAYSSENSDFFEVQKLGALAFNRGMDEFVAILKQYRPDYKVGDALPEFQGQNKSQQPAELVRAFDRFALLRSLSHGNLAANYLAEARFNELNIYNYEKSELDYSRLTQLAVAEVKLRTERIRRSVWPQQFSEPAELIAINVALLNIDQPSGRCSTSKN